MPQMQIVLLASLSINNRMAIVVTMRKTHIICSARLLIAAWLFFALLMIEIANYRANFYLPRSDWAENGCLPTWRVLDPVVIEQMNLVVSNEEVARTQLYHLVESVGLPQYILAFLLLLFRRDHPSNKCRLGGRKLLLAEDGIALLALAIAFYRGYFSSFGYS